MNNPVDFDYFNTQLVHNVGSRVGPIAPSITPSAAFGYQDAEEAEGIFSATVLHCFFSRKECQK